jgi:prepilin-type N-terminal cleavage/methylation domain-containing protein
MSCRNNRRRAGRRPRRPAGKAAGFTLVELMIAIVLLAIILTLLYTSFFQISTGTKRLQEQLAQQQEVRLLLKMIGDDLQAVQYFGGFVEDGEGRKSGLVAEEHAEGNEKFSRVHFHAAIPARFYPQVPPERDPGMHEVAYWVEPSKEDRERLVLMRREDFYLDDDMEEGGVSVRLAGEVRAFLVEFLPVKRRTEEYEDDWVLEWDSADRPKNEPMPMAVRVTLALPDKKGPPVSQTIQINLQPTFKVIQ